MQGQRPTPGKWRWGMLGLTGAIALLTVAAAVAWLGRPETVQASGSDETRFTDKYPATKNTRLDSCSLCHISTTNPVVLNSYGTAYKNNGRNIAAFGLIESLDSDADGFSNIVEINALKFPGNASDKPSVTTATPTRTPARTPTPVNGTPTRTRTPFPTFIPSHWAYLPAIHSQ